MRTLFVFLILLAFPAHAQPLSEKYNLIGQMDTIYGGAETTFYIATIPEDAASFAEIKRFYGKPMLQITGVSADANGDYTNPILSFTIALSGESLGGLHGLSVSEAGRGMRNPTETDGMNGSLQITAFSMSGGAISFDFSAVATRMELDEDWEQRPQEGMDPLEISGHVALEIPAEFIEGS